MEFKSNAKYGEDVRSGTIFRGSIGYEFKLDMTIHRIIHCDGWFLTCARLNIHDRQLKGDSFEDAFEESKGIIKDMVNNINGLILPLIRADAEIVR